MAKTGIWLRGARGRFGGASLAKGQNGNTIIRDVANMTNSSNTINQQVQRMVFATASAAASAFSAIIDHSFQGVKAGAKSIQQFMKLNLKLIRSNVMNELNGDGIQRTNANIKGYKYVQPNSYIMSRGSLYFMDYHLADATGTPFAGNADLYNYLDYETGPGHSQTYSQFLAGLGLKPGDQITVITLDQNAGAGENYNGAYNHPATVRIKRLVFKRTTTVTEFYDRRDNVFKFRTEMIDERRSTATVDELYMVSNGFEAGFTIGAENGLTTVGMAVIRSERDFKGKWMRSSAILATDAAIDAPAATVLPSYATATSESLGSDRYLNNALDETDSDIELVQPATGIQNVSCAFPFTVAGTPPVYSITVPAGTSFVQIAFNSNEQDLTVSGFENARLIQAGEGAYTILITDIPNPIATSVIVQLKSGSNNIAQFNLTNPSE